MIKEAADTIRRCISQLGQVFIARISGEEFGILLPGAHIDAANELVKELAYQIPIVEEKLAEQGTCHIGGAWYRDQVQRGSLLADGAQGYHLGQPETW